MQLWGRKTKGERRGKGALVVLKILSSKIAVVGKKSKRKEGKGALVALKSLSLKIAAAGKKNKRREA